MGVTSIEIKYRQDDDEFWGWYVTINGEDFDSPYASLETALEMATLESRFINGAPRGTARLQIRATTYRGDGGFSISGKDAHGRSVKIFTRKRVTAEHIRDQIKAGIPTTTDSWALDVEVLEGTP